jgi:hypothetical protein
LLQIGPSLLLPSSPLLHNHSLLTVYWYSCYFYAAVIRILRIYSIIVCGWGERWRLV